MGTKTKNNFMKTITLLISLYPLLITTILAEPRRPQPLRQQHFVLVHGAGHGAWCWFKIIPTLRSSGHNVTAIDLAASGINLRPAASLRSVSEYFGPLMGFMESLDEHERVVLVGHSFGGLAVSKAMEMFPSKVSTAVFVTALMPGPTLNISILNQELARFPTPLLDSSFTFGNGTTNPPTMFNPGPEQTSKIFYPHSPAEDKELAKLLVRPMRIFSNEDMARNLVLTKEKYGSVKRVFVLVVNDMVLRKDFQRLMIEGNPPDQVVQIKGSDHMVMVSKPRALGVDLLRIASKCT